MTNKQKQTLLRVTQMNALYLDNEIYNSLLHIVREALTNLPPRLTAAFEHEINLLVKLALINYSVFNKNATFGQQLLQIQYKNLSLTKKLIYLIFSCFDYMKNKVGETCSSTNPINTAMSRLSLVVKVLEIVNISIFLRHGVKPRLMERVLGLEQVYSTENTQRTFDNKYLAREMLWSGFIEILVFMLPLINYHKLKRSIKQYNPWHKKHSFEKLEYRSMTMHTKCACCGENPILPHHMGCAHVFCYVCLKGSQAADSRYECPKCEHQNLKMLICERVSIAV